MTNRNCILFVNGQRTEILPGAIAHHTTAYEYLRETIGVRSLKRISSACGGGSNLGAVMMVTALNPATGVVDTHKALDALSTPIISLHGCAITTLEAISGAGGGGGGKLHPIQARLVAAGATMCGYCTPGVCMLLYTLLMSNMQPTIRDVDRALAGMWCRCSGFRAVNDVARSFAVDFEEALKAKLAKDQSDAVTRDEPIPPMESVENYPPLSSDQAEARVVITSMSRIAALRKEIPLYPHEHLKPPTVVQVPPLYLYYGLNETAFLLPSTVDEVIRSSKMVPDYTTVNGADEFHHQVLSRANTPEGPPMAVLTTARVKEMLEITLKMDGGTPQAPQATIFIGASATLSTISQRIPKLITPELSSKDPWTVAALLELRSAIDDLSATQLEENAFTLVGHLMARPCGDLVPFLHCLKASLVVLSSRGREEHSVVDITGASRSIAKLDVILGLKIPSQRNRFVGFAKATLAGPRSPSTSAVALACDVNRRDGDIVASDFCIACSGSSFYLTVLPEVASCLDKTNLSTETMKNLRNALDKLLMSLRNLVHGPSDGRVSYRITVTRSLIFRLICRLQASVGTTSLDNSAFRTDLNAPQVAISFGVQSWESSYGGICTSRHAANDEHQLELIEAEQPTSSLTSPNISSPVEGAAVQSKVLPPAGGGGKGGANNNNIKSAGNTTSSIKSKSGGASSSFPKSDMPLLSKGLNPLSPSQQPLIPPEPIPAGPIRRMVTPRFPVGDPSPNIRSVPHVTALCQFIPDTLLPRGCLHAAFIRSTIPKGTLKGVDATAALAIPGVVGYFDARDIPVRPVHFGGGGASSSAANFFASRKPLFGAVPSSASNANPSATPTTAAPSRDANGQLQAAPLVLPEETRDSKLSIFVEKDVEFVGQVIGVVIATNATLAKQAAKAVNVEYVRDHRVSYTLSIAESREAKAFFPSEYGNALPAPTTAATAAAAAATTMAASPISGAAGRTGNTFRKLFDNKDLTTHAGSFSIGAQFSMTSQSTSVLCTPGTDQKLNLQITTEKKKKSFSIGAQFSMTSQSTSVLCTPGTDQKLNLQITTENPSFVQSLVASTLLIPGCAVNVSTPPIGGPQAELNMSSALATAVALASYRLRQSVMFVSSLEEDAATRGLSPSATVDWRCAVDPVTSAIQGVDVQVFLNCGAAKGNSDDVLRSILSHISGGYHVPMLRARGVLCRTNFPPSCAHVGVAPAMGSLVMEHIMDAVSRHMKVPRWKLQESHLLPTNEPLPYGQVPQQIRLPTAWQDLIISANVGGRMQTVHKFNATHRFRKRGIAIVPLLVGCRLPVPDDKDRRSGTATVSLFPDGTVSVRHGVVDCGYGVDTKVAQVISRALCIPMELIRIETSSTSGSGMDVSACSATHIAADVACVAALNACEVLLQRLAGVVKKASQDPHNHVTPPQTLGEKVRLAQQMQVPTIATGVAVTGRKAGRYELSAEEASALRNRKDSDPLIAFEPATYDDDNNAPSPSNMSEMSADSPTWRRRHRKDTAAASPQEYPGVLCPEPTATEPHAYFVQGASCAEVELDVLTGTHRVVRADVLVDAGQSLNPLIDAVHIESQFVKGSGWLTAEEVICGDAAHPDVPEGTFLNATMQGNCAYAVPRLHDAVPQDFRVALFGGATSRNLTAGIHGARSVVEASLMSGSAVMFALREAVYAAREHSATEVRPLFLDMNAPLTAERLRMACTDEFSQGTFGGAECAVSGSY
ncbi:xanthine dehydrogenase, putative [Bodo saltans]|uniref:Xanthine dehydrogenase, putative n=1 Tax=Bodo saltans TaxID=75058 RepID=A0A0S4J935_BODSA|nr:xanthine dehydrogenase, putative [Bodo saltans]|eukprot:CUG86634.1 xanthine dehydrogenase, putative [Bodo saltans]